MTFTPIRPSAGLILTLVLGLACSRASSPVPGEGPSDQSAADSSVARRGVDSTIALMNDALRQGDVARTVANYATDFTLLENAVPPVHGVDGIRQRWSQNFAGWTYEEPLMRIDRFHASGGLAIAGGALGGVLREKRAGAEPVTIQVPFLMALRKEPSGRWLIRDLVVVAPPPDSGTPPSR